MPELDPKNIPINQFPELSGKAFQTNFWREANFIYFELNGAHRQKNQELFASALKEVREGCVTPQSLAFLTSLQRSLPRGPVKPTILYAKNFDVDQLNKGMLKELDAATEHKYACKDHVELVQDPPSWAQEKLAGDQEFFHNNHIVPKELVLRKDAQVLNYI